jgi:hypothetical protein
MPEGLQTFLVRVERDEAAIQTHAAGVMEFLKSVEAEVQKMRSRMKQI